MSNDSLGGYSGISDRGLPQCGICGCELVPDSASWYNYVTNDDGSIQGQIKDDEIWAHASEDDPLFHVECWAPVRQRVRNHTLYEFGGDREDES